MNQNSPISVCPLCIKRGITSQLTTISSSSGRVENLCKTKQCLYPFVDYEACRLSVSHDKRDFDTKSMETFWNDLLGNTEDLSIENSPAESQLALQSVQSIVPDITQESCELPNGHYAENCMLSRYLADDMRRVSAKTHMNASKDFRSSAGVTSSPRRSTRQHLAESSCDSGISMSAASLYSRMGYEEQHLVSRHTGCSSASLSPSPSTSVTSYTHKPSRSQSRTQTELMVQQQKQRLRKT